MYKYREDMKFGEEQERIVFDYLKKNYYNTLEKSKKNDIYDFFDTKSKTYIELKSRRCKYRDFETTLYPYNKVKFADEKLGDYKFCFIFNFKDGIYKYDYKGKTKFKIKLAGRVDRDKNEIKQYLHIPIKNLVKI